MAEVHSILTDVGAADRHAAEILDGLHTLMRGDIPKSVRAIKAGATDFLKKPLDETVLVHAVRSLPRTEKKPPVHWVKMTRRLESHFLYSEGVSRPNTKCMPG